jgi:hypothetical protein
MVSFSAISTVALVLILAAATVVAIIGVSFFYTQYQKQNDSSHVQFGDSWHYTGNTTQYFNDVCPDSGLALPCASLTNPPATIEEWSNGSVTAYVGQITYNSQTYHVVIIDNSTYCVAPKVPDRPGCPQVIN